MKRQRNMTQMKEQRKTPEKERNKMERSSLSDAEFKTLVIRIFKELIGSFNSIKKTQAEMKVTLSEIKKYPQRTNSGEDEVENQINKLEHKEEKKIQSEQQQETRIQKSKDRLRSLWDNFKRTNIQIIGVPEGESESKKLKTYLKK